MALYYASDFYYALVDGGRKFGVKSIYRCVAPIVVYCVTLVFLIVLQKVKIVTKSK